MFEFSVACKYLIPRRRQLSVSIISLISILVIALVVWLIVVFFSVTDGLEKNWVQKLTALTAPIRITPTEAYYHSYYYQVDSISEASQYSSKTIREKKASSLTDPYNPEVDEEIPVYWSLPDVNAQGTVKDLVKGVYDSLNEIKNVPGLYGQDFELTATHIRLHLLRPSSILHAYNVYGGTTQSALSYPAYLGNFEQDNPDLSKTLLPIEAKDLNNTLSLLGTLPDDNFEEMHHERKLFNPSILQKRLGAFFEFVTIKQLKTRLSGWTIPASLFPIDGQLEVCAVLKDQKAIRVMIPLHSKEILTLQKNLEEQGLKVVTGQLIFKEGASSLYLKDALIQIAKKLPLTLVGNSTFNAQLDPSSIASAKKIENLVFNAEIFVQGLNFKGRIYYRGLEIAQADLKAKGSSESSPFWIYSFQKTPSLLTYRLPKDTEVGEGIALPKSFRDAGVMMGDRGSLSYLSPTASVLQEQHIPIYVAGFYDPGIIPIGGKFILANQEVTSLIRSSHQQEDKTAMTNGINVRFNRLHQVDEVKNQLLQALQAKGIHRYWNIETYREYEFTKEIMRELQSQKNLFMLIAIVIILVACSNIISMLIILVNDKKMEIGILRSMGASSKNIALIFGISGALIGILGSMIGICFAVFTLHYLETLVSLISAVQGHDLFNANVYGQVLPHELSLEALSFVLIATVFLSLLAGIVPAIKACLLRPSQILRASGG